jgi:hypothetical protein
MSSAKPTTNNGRLAPPVKGNDWPAASTALVPDGRDAVTGLVAMLVLVVSPATLTVGLGTLVEVEPGPPPVVTVTGTVVDVDVDVDVDVVCAVVAGLAVVDVGCVPHVTGNDPCSWWLMSRNQVTSTTTFALCPCSCDVRFEMLTCFGGVPSLTDTLADVEPTDPTWIAMWTGVGLEGKSTKLTTTSLQFAVMAPT